MNTRNMIAVAVPAILIYLAASGKIKHAVAATAAIAIGSVTLVKKVPVANEYLG